MTQTTSVSVSPVNTTVVTDVRGSEMVVAFPVTVVTRGDVETTETAVSVLDSSTSANQTNIAYVSTDIVTTITNVGEQGPPGENGIGTLPVYEYTQVVAQAAWTVPHNLGRKPLVEVHIDNEQVSPRVTHPSDNTALLEFGSAYSGQALCY